MIKIIFGIICILVGVFWSIVAVHGLYDSINNREKYGVLLGVFLAVVSAVAMVCGIGCFV